MKVLVLGAGVIGITTAYFLKKAGCNVTIIDRHEHSAMESSFANGAQLSYTHADPLASWSNVHQGLKWLGRSDSPLHINWKTVDLELIKWFFKFLRECPKSRREFNMINLLRLSFFSRQVIHEINESLRIKYNFKSSGILYLLRNKELLEKETKLFEYYSKHSDTEFEILSKDKCIKHDPSTEIIMKEKYGGILTKVDEVGDVYQFAREMEKHCKKLGVEFIRNCELESLETHMDKIVGATTSKGYISADKFVCCLGAYSSPLLKSIGVKTNIYPVKGYSLSVPSGKGYTMPKSSVFDLDRKIVFTKMGNILRTAGTAEFTGFDHSINDKRIKPIINATKKFFPNGGDYSNVEKWSCLRPLTPHYNPYLGRTKYNNLFLNTGHGFLGWTTGPGSAKIISDIVTNQEPPIDLTGFETTYT